MSWYYFNDLLLEIWWCIWLYFVTSLLVLVYFIPLFIEIISLIRLTSLLCFHFYWKCSFFLVSVVRIHSLARHQNIRTRSLFLLYLILHYPIKTKYLPGLQSRFESWLFCARIIFPVRKQLLNSHVIYLFYIHFWSNSRNFRFCSKFKKVL